MQSWNTRELKININCEILSYELKSKIHTILNYWITQIITIQKYLLVMLWSLKYNSTEIPHYLLFEKSKSCLAMSVNWDTMLLNPFVNFSNAVTANRSDRLATSRSGGRYFGSIGGNPFILSSPKFDRTISLLTFSNTSPVASAETTFKTFI